MNGTEEQKQEPSHNLDEDECDLKEEDFEEFKAARVKACLQMETEEFCKCQLTKRHWEIERGEGQNVQVIEGEGVVGYYPTIEKGMN